MNIMIFYMIKHAAVCWVTAYGCAGLLFFCVHLLEKSKMVHSPILLMLLESVEKVPIFLAYAHIMLGCVAGWLATYKLYERNEMFSLLLCGYTWHQIRIILFISLSGISIIQGSYIYTTYEYTQHPPTLWSKSHHGTHNFFVHNKGTSLTVVTQPYTDQECVYTGYGSVHKKGLCLTHGSMFKQQRIADVKPICILQDPAYDTTRIIHKVWFLLLNLMMIFVGLCLGYCPSRVFKKRRARVTIGAFFMGLYGLYTVHTLRLHTVEGTFIGIMTVILAFCSARGKRWITS